MFINRGFVLIVAMVLLLGAPSLVFAQTAGNVTVEVKLPIADAPHPQTLVFVAIYDVATGHAVGVAEQTFTTRPPYTLNVAIAAPNFNPNARYYAQAQVGTPALVRSYEGNSAQFVGSQGRAEVQTTNAAPGARIIRVSAGTLVLLIGALLTVGAAALFVWRRMRLQRLAPRLAWRLRPGLWDGRARAR